MASPKRRKPRPPRGRGLRSTVGCLTCRSRRLKCDEARPTCLNCAKSSRECSYLQQAPVDDENTVSSATTDTRERPASGNLQDLRARVNGNSTIVGQRSISEEPLAFNDSSLSDSFETEAFRGPTDFVRSPSTTASFTAGTAPYQWYELIAQDAWKNAESYHYLTSHGSRWSFNSDGLMTLNTLASPASSVIQSPETRAPAVLASRSDPAYQVPDHQPWNTLKRPLLKPREVQYLQHYIDFVGPFLDLFDSHQHFTTDVLRLALRNEGLLKSILALAASHKSTYPVESQKILSVDSLLLGDQASRPQKSDRELAVEYYYETLGYLSQAMRIPGYAHSQEILANAVLISWFEAFESDSSQNWERHLKGVFWIQRSQDVNGESAGTPGAIWWSWLRQDLWAAFRNGRRPLTIHVPTKLVNQLSPDELACRALFLQARVVSYASIEAHETADLEQRMAEGNELLSLLEGWRNAAPQNTLQLDVAFQSASKSAYPPVWIHPPIFAAAMQAYNSAKILLLLNQPSRGGREEFHNRQKLLEESVASICGISAAPNATHPPLAMANSQALFIAGQALQKPESQRELLHLLRTSLEAAKSPFTTLETELRQSWGLL
ncbi:uncharacterized protein HMPREF1541_05887 [Cyphellophora europaea CBS 101466]|uniref:Zn(2)-C6 fungal-type domain-containing protein n=1 Tax=Cyphellophora europaea (strain CBS 101466) TaxID=1220924 RepID=W2RT11_CYPE1|nr:uncharacterized protein HMPREF1541_05887 [Cyphellophora europaea CBS 101466]ETN39661.1 hypothetical protein HMPREF1541_05887 [Cyphellophora europaea CBS 101466]